MLVRTQPPDASTPLGTAAPNGLPKPRGAAANADGARAASEPRSPGGQRRLTILHFNDVYEIDARAREPVGGVSRFTSLLASYASEDPCVIFSGDFLAPSLLSTETHGMHMIPFFNRMNIKACVLGNRTLRPPRRAPPPARRPRGVCAWPSRAASSARAPPRPRPDDFDHGLEHTAAAMAAANFPFLLSNAVDLSTGKQLAGAARTLVLEHSGVRIGFIGLIEEEWLATLACIEPSQVRYTDYVAVARELEPWLRAEEGCELVVALTHCRLPNDRRLAAECPGLDLILGGHDHDAFREVVHGVPLVKSGTDFRELTKLVLTLPAAAQAEAAGAGPAGGAREPAAPRSSGRRCEVAWERLLVTSDIPEDAEAAAMVAECGKELAKSMGIVVAELGTPLDFRFAHIRTRETNGSNFIADVLRGATPAAEIALVNCGTLRAVRARRGPPALTSAPAPHRASLPSRRPLPCPSAPAPGRRAPARPADGARPGHAAADARRDVRARAERAAAARRAREQRFDVAQARGPLPRRLGRALCL